MFITNNSFGFNNSVQIKPKFTLYLLHAHTYPI